MKLFTVKVLLGILFFLIGFLFLFFVSGPRLLLYFKLKDALPVPVKEVLSLKLEHDEGYAFVECLYTYEVEGKRHSSDKIMVFEMSSSSLNKYHENLFEDLKQIRDNPRENQTPLLCYVNPNNHGEAAINRDFTPLALVYFFIPICFMLFGAGGIFLTLSKKKNSECMMSLTSNSL